MGWSRLVLLMGAMIFASITWHVTVLDRIVIAIAIVLAVSWVWNRLALTGLGFERSLAVDRLHVGDLVSEEMTLTNHSRFPKLWVEIEDSSSLSRYRGGRVVSLRGKRSTTWTVETRAIRRGKFRLGPSAISGGDPFGIFQSRRVLPIFHQLTVFPAQVDVSAIRLPTARLDGGRNAPRVAMASSSSIHGIREYTPGDPMNRIAWRATAHRGSLMVKEFEPDPTADLWILFDLNDDGQFDLHHRESIPGAYQHLNTTVEYIVSIGASLATDALNEGKKVGVILNRQDPIRIEPDNSQRQWLKIAETLAVVTSAGSRSITESLLADHRRFSRNSGLVVITADPRSDWVAAGASLVERLVPVTAVIVDAGGEGQDDISPLLHRLAAARVQVHRYPTHTAVMPTAKVRLGHDNRA